MLESPTPELPPFAALQSRWGGRVWRCHVGRAVVHESFGGPEVLEVRDVPEPHPGPGEVRVRVAAASINPPDWMLALSAEIGELMDYAVPSGFGTDLAGFVDEVGMGVDGFEVGDRVFGASRGRSIADHAIVSLDRHMLEKTPQGISDEVACTIPLAGRAATAALGATGVGYGDTLLVGGAAGGVGTFVVQLAKITGARVIGTASPGTFDYLRAMGVEPVAYGAGLADRVGMMAPNGVTAAVELVGVETVDAALQLGVHVGRICTLVPGSIRPPGVRRVGSWDAPPDAARQITEAVLADKLRVHIAATFPIEKVRDAVAMQAGGHVHGKVVVTL